MDTREVPQSSRRSVTKGTLIINGISMEVVLVDWPFSLPEDPLEPERVRRAQEYLDSVDPRSFETFRPESQLATDSLQRSNGVGPRNRWGGLK